MSSDIPRTSSTSPIPPTSQGNAPSRFSFTMPTIADIKSCAKTARHVAYISSEFCLRTAAAMAVGVVGTVVSMVAFSAWVPFCLPVGCCMMCMAAATDSGDGDNPGVVFGAAVALGPVTTGSATMVLMAYCYKGFLESTS